MTMQRTDTAIVAGAAILLALLVGLSGMWWMPHWGWSSSPLWGMGMAAMMLFPLALLGLFLYGVVRLAGAGREATPKEILDARLARGEIDVEEHQRRHDALRRQ